MDLRGPILSRFIAETWGAHVTPLRLPPAPGPPSEPASQQSDYVFEVVFGAYRLVNRLHTLPSIKIRSEATWHAAYGGAWFEEALGFYSVTEYRGMIRLRDMPVLEAIVVGFHECGERETIAAPATARARFLGHMLNDDRPASPWDDWMRAYKVSHEHAYALQILLTERCELDGHFEGALRQTCLRLLERTGPPVSDFALGYMARVHGVVGTDAQWFRDSLSTYSDGASPPEP